MGFYCTTQELLSNGNILGFYLEKLTKNIRNILLHSRFATMFFICLFTKEYKFLDTLTTHLRLLLEVAQSSPAPLPFPHPTPFMSHLLLGRCCVQPICPINPIHVNLLLFKIVIPGQGKREFERHTSTRSGHFLRFSAVI